MPATTDWSALLDEERRLRAAVIELGEPLDPGGLRRWWSVVTEVLKTMVRLEGRFLEAPPMELFDSLSGLTGYLAAGQVPAPIAGVARRGRASPGPTEVSHIRVAVTYRRAVENKLIDDPHPVKTIMTAYGLCSRRTVQEWCARHPPFDLNLWADIPEALAKKMWRGGEVYRGANKRTWSSRAKSRGARK